MKKLNGREMKALFVLSIIVPVSLLVTLRLTGILQGPVTITETTILEAVRWEFERPHLDQYVPIDKKLDVTYAADGLSATLRLWIFEFINGPPGSDNILMSIAINSTTINNGAFVKSVDVVFNEYSQPSIVDWQETYLDFKNLSLLVLSDGYVEQYDEKALVRLTNENRTSEVYFSAVVFWDLLTSNTQAHQAEITYELTYFNGTAYKKIIQPFQLRILGR